MIGFRPPELFLGRNESSQPTLNLAEPMIGQRRRSS
jgi:hypothetical protein